MNGEGAWASSQGRVGSAVDVMPTNDGSSRVNGVARASYAAAARAISVFERADGDKHVQSGVIFSMSKQPIWLLRSKERSGRNDFSIGHDQDYALVPRVSDEDGAEPS